MTRARKDDLEILSASTLVKAHNTDGLANWRVGRIFEYAAGLGGHPFDQNAANDYVYAAPHGHRYGSAQTGTILHATLEAWLQGMPTPDYVEDGDRGQLVGLNDPSMAYAWPMAEQLSAFLAEHPTRPVLQERFVFNPETRIGGRLDLIADIKVDGVERRLLVDLKTSIDDQTKWGREKKPWVTDVALQLATYRYATHIDARDEPRVVSGRGRRIYLVSPNDLVASSPMVDVDGCAVLFLTPARCDLWELNITPAVYDQAQRTAASWRWQFDDDAEGIMAASPTVRVRAK